MAKKAPEPVYPKGNAKVGDRVLVGRDAFSGPNVEPWFSKLRLSDIGIARGKVVKVGVGHLNLHVVVKFDGLRQPVEVSPHLNRGLVVRFVPAKVPSALKQAIPKGFVAVRFPGNTHHEVFGIANAKTLETISVREQMTEYAELKFHGGTFYQGKPSLEACDQSFVVNDREIELRTEIEVEPYN